MSLGSALATAMSGLRANQAALSITSSNIANAQTPGYVTESINQVEVADAATPAPAVSVTGVNRELDQYVQTQLRTETSGGAGYADQMSNILTQLQRVYGTPGRPGTLETASTISPPRCSRCRRPLGQLVGADHGRDRGADAGAAAQRDDAGHPDAAHQRRAGHRHFGGAGQYAT